MTKPSNGLPNADAHRTSGRRAHARHAIAVAALTGAALTLGACNSATVQTAQYESVASDDYRQRHPIRMAAAPVNLTLDVHRGAAGLTASQVASLRAFAASYEGNGEGPIVLSVPAGGANAVAVEHAAQSAVAALNRAGIAYVDTRHVPTYPGASAALTLTYYAVGARVENCGLWPADAAITTSHDNRSYHNFGCASQRNFAAQVANPQDLIRPRTATKAGAARRYTVLKKYGAGESTATVYDDTQDTQISIVGN